MGCHFLLQGIFPTQGLNTSLPHCRQTLYHLSHRGSPCWHMLSPNTSPCHTLSLALSHNLTTDWASSVMTLSWWKVLNCAHETGWWSLTLLGYVRTSNTLLGGLLFKSLRKLFRILRTFMEVSMKCPACTEVTSCLWPRCSLLRIHVIQYLIRNSKNNICWVHTTFQVIYYMRHLIIFCLFLSTWNNPMR